MFLVALADSGAALSLDARRGGERTSVPAWPVTLMKLQLSIVYGYAALAKLNVYFLSGALLAAYLREGGLLVVPDALRTFPVVTVLAVASVLLEAYLALALWSARQRRYAVVLGIGFHLAVSVTIAPTLELLVFAVQSLAVYALFLDEATWSGLVVRGASRSAAPSLP